MTSSAPAQRTASVRSATSAPTSSTSTCSNRFAKRYSPQTNCWPPSAPCSPERPTRTSWWPRNWGAWTPPFATKERERARLLDAYQAGLLELEELTRRTSALAARRAELTREKQTLSRRSAELTAQNRMRRRLAGFSDRIAASLDDLDFAGRRRLVRLVVEKVTVTAWRVEIHLKIPLPNDPPPDEDRPDHRPPGPHPPTPQPPQPKPPSSDTRLRSDHRDVARGDLAARDPATARSRRPRHHLPLPARDRQHRDHCRRP